LHRWQQQELSSHRGMYLEQDRDHDRDAFAQDAPPQTVSGDVVTVK